MFQVVSCIYYKGYYLMIKSYSSVVVKFTTKVEFHQSFCRTILSRAKKTDRQNYAFMQRKMLLCKTIVNKTTYHHVV
jgi:hypothetical protein